MRRTLLTIVLLACGGSEPQPQTTQVGATAAQPAPPPPVVTASAAPSAAPAEETAAPDDGADAGSAGILGAIALDGGPALASLSRSDENEALGTGHGHGSHVTIRQGTTMINGRIPPAIIQRIVRQHFPSFRACYERGLRQDPSLAGRVAIKFVIGSNGTVTLAADGGSDIPNVDVISCDMRVFKSLIFPKPERGIVTVVYPLILSSSP